MFPAGLALVERLLLPLFLDPSIEVLLSQLVVKNLLAPAHIR